MTPDPLPNPPPADDGPRPAEHADAMQVVVYDAPADPHAVAQVLVDVLGMQPIDALIHARAAPGVMPDRLPRAQAEELAARLAEQQIDASVVDPRTLPDLRHSLVSHHLRCGSDGLETLDLRGDVDRIVPWKELALVSVGQTPLESARRTDTEDAHVVTAGPHARHSATAVRLPAVMEAILIAADGRTALRFDQTRMNYETLGDLMSDSAADNFRKLLIQILTHAPHAARTPATEAWLRNASLFKFLFESSQHLQRATLLHWLRLRHDPATAADAG